jgi:exodeoxyribonuclease X
MLMRVIDFETTGLDRPPAEVIEVGYCDYNRATGQVEGGNSYLCGVKSLPPDAQAIHHIYESDVDGLPPFDPDKVLENALGSEVVCFAAHNAEFEEKWLGRTLEGVLPLVCTYKAALRIWPDAPSHNNFALVYWLEGRRKIFPVREKLQPAHRALPDAYTTAHILQALYAEGVTGAQLVKWTGLPRLMPTCPIGKFRGKSWPDVEQGFLAWITRTPDMDSDIVWNAQQEINRRNGNEPRQ